MTISTVLATITLPGNDVNTVFTFPFEIPYQDDGVTPAITVYTLHNGVKTTLVPDDYTITGIGNPTGGTVTYTGGGTPVPTGDTITISRDKFLTQPYAFPNNALLPSTIEAALDNVVMEMQQLLDIPPVSLTGLAPLDSPVLTGNPQAPTPPPGDHDHSIANTQFVTDAITTAVASVTTLINNVVPTGSVGQFFMAALPTGWLVCNGAAVSRTTYAALFAVVGTTYGVGNGTTTFNIPEVRGYFLRGLNTSNAGLDPNRVLGTHQSDDVGSHTHLNGYAARSGTDNPMIYATSTQDVPGASSKSSAPSNTPSDIQGTTSAAGGADTHPANLAVVIAIHI